MATKMEAYNNTQELLANLRPEVYDIMHQYLAGRDDKSLDLREPHLRPSVASSFPFILFMYGLLMVTGLGLNLSVCVHVIRNKLFKDETYSFILNNAVCDIVKCVAVLPITLYVLLINNWVLGELLCSFLPMLQVRLVCGRSVKIGGGAGIIFRKMKYNASQKIFSSN